MKTIIIVAMTADRLIGKEGRLPWHEPEDLKHFKRTTTGHAVIMGRKTYESIGKPLPERRNIVITRNRDYAAGGVDVAHSLDEGLDLCRQRGEEKAFIVGGAQIYEQALPAADEMIVTMIERLGLTGDTYFPAWNPADWDETEIAAAPPLRIVRYKRRE